MATLESLEKEIEAIKQRNRNVELDKVWETSLSRKIVLAGGIYLSVVIALTIIGTGKPFLNAIIPALGFMLSTLTLPFFKKIWAKYIYR